jgi:hypothetical protein
VEALLFGKGRIVSSPAGKRHQQERLVAQKPLSNRAQTHMLFFGSAGLGMVVSE